jgi:hypothetical protein
LADSHITARRPQAWKKVPLGKGWGTAPCWELWWSTQEVIVWNCKKPDLCG